SAPAPLAELARENARPEPAHPTLEGFSRALAFYERPNRRADLVAVAGRMSSRTQADHTREIVAELRQRVLAQPEPGQKVLAEPESRQGVLSKPETPAPKPQPAAAPPRRFSTRQLSIAAAAV